MVKSALPCFSADEQRHLRTLVRLVFEFHDFLSMRNSFQQTKGQLMYMADSIFSGIDSFCYVNDAYRVLKESEESKFDWLKVSKRTLTAQFGKMFDDFCVESNFERRCRILLDLFRIQIVYAAAVYP
jgi:hypothetical protein